MADSVEIKVEKTETSLEIQKYYDMFNKELQENEEELIEISQFQEVDQEDDEEERAVGEEDGAYFVDEDGQFYFQPSSSGVIPIQISADKGETEEIRPSDILPEGSTQFEFALDGENDENSEELSYIYIVEESDVGNVASGNNREENDITVYDFDENDDEEKIVDDRDDGDDYDVKRRVMSKNVASSELLKCNYCDYETNKKFLLSRHLKTHSDEKPHKCSFCCKGFRTVVGMTNHINTHTGTKPHRCDVCNAGFATTGEMVRHVRYKHTNMRPHKCNECDYAAVEMSKLRRHQRCHSGERPYQCPHCTYASPDTFKLKRHLRVHTGERPYGCDVCGAAFSQSNSLKAHRLTHYPENKRYFQCQLCPARCGRKADLRGHIRKLHTATEPLECKRCGKRLPDRYSYKLHVRTHGGEKSFKCDVCPYASISQLHLTSHMLIHTNEKPFSCEQCDQHFRQKQLLKRHQNLYHNPNYVPPEPKAKNHECDQCGKKFIHQGNLIRHLALHDPESNVHELNVALKKGRKQRIANVDNSTDNDYYIEDNSGEEDIARDEEEEDDEQYVVFEMIQVAEDGKETKIQVVETTVDDAVKKKVKVNIKEDVDTKRDMENCFGFDEDDDDDGGMITTVRHSDDDEEVL